MNKSYQWLFLVVFLFYSNAWAAPLLQIDESGFLIGAKGVIVGGLLYDVRFVDGTCIALFDGCESASDFAFSTEQAGLTASQALLDQVLRGSYDADPGRTSGCLISAIVCYMLTPFAVESRSILAAEAINVSELEFPFGPDGEFSPVGIGSTQDTGDADIDGNVYAIWSRSVLAAPEPSVSLCFGIAGLALIWARHQMFRCKIGLK